MVPFVILFRIEFFRNYFSSESPNKLSGVSFLIITKLMSLCIGSILFKSHLAHFRIIVLRFRAVHVTGKVASRPQSGTDWQNIFSPEKPKIRGPLVLVYNICINIYHLWSFRVTGGEWLGPP